jgi:AcrR family transcriptional regulator
MKSLPSLPAKSGRQRVATHGTDEKRERILDAAEQLFAAQGYANTTVEQIVQALGVTKPFVYYYFSSKQEIFETLAWRPAVACFTVLDFPDDDSRPAHEKVKTGIEQLIRATTDYLVRQRELAEHFYERLCALLEEGRDDGWFDFNETRVTAHAACSVSGFLYSWYKPDGRLNVDEIVPELVKTACRALGLRSTRRKQRSDARS